LASVSASRFRVSGIVARLGGEVFCVLALDLAAEQAAAFAPNPPFETRPGLC